VRTAAKVVVALPGERTIMSKTELNRARTIAAPIPAESKSRSRSRSKGAVAGILVVAVVLAALLDTAIAALGHAAGASHQFNPLEPPAFVSFTLFGILIGAAGWAIVRRRAARARALLRRLVPGVLAVSFIPDLAMLVVSYLPHSNAAGVVALLGMHVVVATIAVTAYTRAMPVDSMD
jgi:hypothetical protein